LPSESAIGAKFRAILPLREGGVVCSVFVASAVFSNSAVARGLKPVDDGSMIYRLFPPSGVYSGVS